MTSILKGNFQTKRAAQADLKKPEDSTDLEERFEAEALKRLGGSIAFVSKKKIDFEFKD